MADPLSISASIIAIIQLSGTAIEYLNGVKSASGDRQRLLAEITSLSGFLYVLKDRAGQSQPDDPWASTLKSLDGPEGPLVQFKVALERLTLKLTPAEGWKRAENAMAWPFRKEEVKEILTTIERHKSLFSLAIQNDHIGLSQTIGDDVRGLHDEIYKLGKGVAQLEISQLNSEAQNVLKWLSPLEFPLQQSDYISKCQKGTGQWFIESDEFKTWLDETGQTLYCPGIPGSGKTMLTSITIDYLTNYVQSKDIGIAYIFCNYQSRLEQSPVNLLASLLKQLLQSQSSLSNEVKNLSERHLNKRSRPTLDEVSSALHLEIDRYSRVYILVDALDECTDDDNTQGRLLSGLHELQAKTAVNLMVTSRMIHKIQQKFQSVQQMQIRASDEDVKRYLGGQMGRLARCVMRDVNLQNDITSEIANTVDGMFLLARLHLDSLIGKTSPKAIRNALCLLPKGSGKLDTAYNEAMKRIEGQSGDSPELAKKVLSWISYARRQLTVRELQHALAVEPNESELDEGNMSDIEDIVSVCAGLVTIDRDSDIVRLVHYTTQEYFERVRCKRFPHAEQQIATTCLSYLLFDIFLQGRCSSDEALEARLQRDSLLDYAARHWGSHARGNVGQAVHMLALEFLTSDSKVSCSVQVMLTPQYRFKGYSQQVINHVLGIHICAYFGLQGMISGLLKTKTRADLEDEDGRTPLSWAAERGHEAVVRLLAERDDVTADSKDKYGQTPLSRAAAGGHEAVVRLLAERDDVTADSKDKYGQTPLSRAAAGGHEAVMRLLAERDDVTADSKDKYGRTPLSRAAEGGHEAVVRLLTERDDVTADSKDNIYGQTPLSWAAEGGHEAVMRLLAKRDDVTADSKDKSGQTPLSWAAKEGHEAVARLLVERDDVTADSKDVSGRTPLSRAAAGGHEAVARLLAERDDVTADSKDVSGRTPLSRAAERGHEAMVRLLKPYTLG